MNSPSSSLPSVLSKITRADMGLILPRLDDNCLDDHGNTVPARKSALDAAIAKYSWAYDLGGRIIEVKTVKGKGDEPGVRFVGKFRAHINPAIQDKWFVSGRCHVPKFFEEVMYGQVIEAKNVDPNATIDFLIRVGIKPPKPGKPSAVGYEWTVDTLVSADVYEDPVMAMFEKAAAPVALAPPVAPEGGASETAAVAEEAPEPVRSRGHRR